MGQPHLSTLKHGNSATRQIQVSRSNMSFAPIRTLTARASVRMALLCTAWMLTGCAQALAPGEIRRAKLSAFDASKATQISPEKRAALEHELFSELSLWNRGSVQYPTSEDINRREQRWLAMANEGFELAHITLRVLQPSTGRVYELQQPMQRLVKLAEAGDVGAMCLMTGLVNEASARINTDTHEELYKKWLERGATLGHPECKKALGGRLLRGVDGYTKNTSRGIGLIFESRKAGYIHDAGSTILHYKSKGYEDSDNLKRLYCWKVIDAKTYVSDPMDSLKYSIEKQSAKLLMAKQAELNELQGWQPQVEDCINLGTGESR
jgi:hypothetical protein